MADSRDTDCNRDTPRSNPSRRRWLKIAASGIAAILIAIWLAFWLYHRMTHVSAKDARVTTHEITVSSRLGGRVTGFDLIEGDRLQQQDLIAQLYSTPDRLKLAQIKSRIANIKARLQMSGQQIAGGVDQTTSMLAADIAAMHAAASRVGKARDNYQRAQKLYEAHSGSQKQRDIYRYDYQSAQADYQRAQSQVATDRVSIANARSGILPGGQTSVTPKVLQSQLKIARAQLAHQQNMINDLAVKSPIHGVIDKTFIETDEYVSAGQPILMMHDPGDVWIEANIKETMIHSLRVGQPVAVAVDARPDTIYRGHVQVIGNAATNQFALLPDPNPSGNFTKITQRIPVRIAIDHGPRTRLSPGMMVEVDVDITGDGWSAQRRRQERVKTRGAQSASSDTARTTRPAGNSAHAPQSRAGAAPDLGLRLSQRPARQ